MTTTGYASADYAPWTMLTVVTLVGLMLSAAAPARPAARSRSCATS